MKKLFAALAILLFSFGLVACAVEITETAITVTAPTKIVYELDDEINLTGMLVKVTMSDGTQVTLSPDKYTVSGFTSATAGQKTVTVTYGTLTATFTVTVNPAPAPAAVVTGITLTPPTKVIYTKGQALDRTGMIVTKVYSDGSKVVLDNASTEIVITGFSTVVEGNFTVTVVAASFTRTFTITVISGQALASNTLVVGTPSLNGDFIAGFGNSSYDNWVRKLIYGYGTIVATKGGDFIVNPTVVANHATILDTAVVHPVREHVIPEVPATATAPAVPEIRKNVQDKTYTFEIRQNLTYSDGRPIKAADFVFGLLFSASHEWRVAGATSTAGEYLTGYNIGFANPYRPSGQTTSANRYFSGVKLLSEYSFSVTINGYNLPYFYELSLIGTSPMPYHVLADATFDPAVDIVSDANGTKLTAKAFTKIPAIVAPGGYRFAPTVTSGPYRFVSFQNQIVTLARNPEFKGNYEGKIPTIQTVIIKRINQIVDVDLVIAGDVDLIAGVIEGAKIDKAKANVNSNVTFYARNGYGIVAINCDFGPTKDYRVRQAIGLLVDRGEFVDEILGGYGSLVNSMYGLSQWMVEAKQEELDEALINYQLNVGGANTLLATTEWKYESDGVTLFDPAKAATLNNGTIEGNVYFRHNAAREVLQINHMGTVENTITDLIGIQFPKYFGRAGIKFTIKFVEFNELLDNYYYSYNLKPTTANPTDRRMYHTFNLASNFGAAFDPYYSFHSDWYDTWYNANQLVDSRANPAMPLGEGELTIDELTVLMRELNPNQRDEFLEYWFDFVVRWNKLLPNLPLYSNEYYDVFNKRISGVTTSPFWDWSDAINDIRIAG
jgi:peptide/nickel transport system substrate-binding protein